MSYSKYEHYKSSNIDWLGDIPAHWEVRKIKNYCTVVNGATPESSKAEYWDGEITWVTPADIDNNTMYIDKSARSISQLGYNSCGTSLLPPNSIILTTRAPIGKLAIAKKDVCTNQGCKSLIPNNINPKYLYYQLQTRANELNALGTGTTFMELSTYKLKNLLLPIPSPTEQIAIAAYLDHKLADIDTFIAKKQRLITLLQEQKAAMINKAVTKGLNENEDAMKDSGVNWIGKTPAYWDIKRLKYIAKIINGVECEKSNEGAYPVYGSGGIFGYTSKFMYDKPTVLLGRKGTINKPLFVDSPFWVVDTAFYTKIKENVMLPKLFYYCCLNFPFGYYTYGSALPSMTQSSLYELKIPVPPLTEQIAIVSHIEAESARIDKAISLIERELTLVQEYRTALIAEAVTGKIKCPDVAQGQGIPS